MGNKVKSKLLHWVRDNRFKTNLLLYWFSGTVARSPTYCHDSKT